MTMYRPHRLCRKENKPKEPSLYRSLCISILSMLLSTVMLVGTTFAWFDSSATSAISTITASSLNVATSYITQSTVRGYADTNSSNSTTEIPSDAWIPFDGNGGNPFGSIPFRSNDAQVIFLKLTNNGSSPATYRLALNLLGDTSVSANSGSPENSLSSLLRYGCSVLGPVGTNSTELNFLSTATIPGAVTSSDGKPTYSANVTPESSSETPPPVEISGSFVDALSSHSSTETEHGSDGKVTRITYGGHICKVELAAGQTQYVAVSLYMPNNFNYSNSTALVYIQLAMTVNQPNAENPLMPNVVGSNTITTQQDLDAAFRIMYESLVEEDETPVVDETAPTEDDTVKDAEAPTEAGDAADQPTSGNTETPSTETPTGSPAGTESGAGAAESGTAGTPDANTDTPVTESGTVTESET